MELELVIIAVGVDEAEIVLIVQEPVLVSKVVVFTYAKEYIGLPTRVTSVGKHVLPVEVSVAIRQSVVIIGEADEANNPVELINDWEVLLKGSGVLLELVVVV